jgi:ubiquitin conjugation factor E4 B
MLIQHPISAKIVSYFALIAKDAVHCFQVCSLTPTTQRMFTPLLEFYTSIRVTGANATNFDRLYDRTVTSDLLINWFSIPDLMAFFLANAASPVCSNFVFYLVDDALYFAHESAQQLKTISDAARQLQTLDPGERRALLAEVGSARRNLAAWSRAVAKALQLMRCIAAFARALFHEAAVLDDVAKLLLCTFDLFANHAECFAPESLSGGAFDHRSFLLCVLRFAAAVDGDETIVDRLVDDTTFPAAPFAAAVIGVATAERIDADAVSRFARFTAFVHERARVADERRIDTADAPDEFLDALTCELMRDPVRLPSGNVLDRGTARKMLLARPVDPFTMTALRIEECVPDEELGRKIAEYLMRKRAQKKKEKERGS